MAYSRINYVGNGSQTQFAINFPLGFLTRSDVTCYVIGEVDGLGNQVYRTLTWINDGLVQISGAVPANGTTVVFERTVDKETLVHDYSDGSSIIEENLDQSNKQNIMLVHEVLDGRFGVLADDIDMGQHAVKNLVDPVDQQDAVNLQYFEANNALANRQAAEAAQAAAEQAEVNAELAEANAEAAAAAAAAAVTSTLAGYVTSAQEAKTAAETAETNAETAEANAELAKAAAEAARDEAVVAVCGIKITNTDTTAAKANDKIVVSGILTKTVLNSGGNEQLQLGFDMTATNAAISAATLKATTAIDIAVSAYIKADIAGSDTAGVYGRVFSDDFETDTIGATSTNATYYASGQYYHNFGGYGVDVTGGKTYYASAAAVGSASAAFNDSPDHGTGANGWVPNNTKDYASPYWVAVDLGVGNAKVARKLRMHPLFTTVLYLPKDFKLQGSNNSTNGSDGAWADVYTGVTANANAWQEFTFANGTAYRWYRVWSTNTHAGQYPGLAEVEIIDRMVPTNMTLMSGVITLPAEPDDVSVYVEVQDVDTIVNGTDRKVYASIDNGTTWAAAATYTVVGVWGSTDGLLRADIDVSAQAGTSLKWKLETLNTKEQQIKQVTGYAA